MPTSPTYYVDKALTNVSIAYANDADAFLAEKLFPRLQVQNKTGVYYLYDKANLRAENDVRAPGNPANEVEYELSTAAFGPLIDHALKTKVTDEEVQQSDVALRPFSDATEFLTDKMMVAKEIDAQAKFAAASNVTTLSGTSQWSDYTNSDPVSAIRAASDLVRLRVLHQPNTIVIGYQVFSTLLLHPALKNLLATTVDKVLTAQKLAEFFNVDTFLIGGAAYNSAVKGATDSIGYIWGKDAYVAYIEPNPGLRKMSAAYGLELTNGWTMSRWYDEDRESTYLRIKRFYEHKITNQDAIQRIAAAIA